MSTTTAHGIGWPGNVAIADNLRRLMDDADVDVAELARRTGVPAKRIEGILGVTTEAMFPEFARFVHCFGVDVSELLPAAYQ